MAPDVDPASRRPNTDVVLALYDAFNRRDEEAATALTTMGRLLGGGESG